MAASVDKLETALQSLHMEMKSAHKLHENESTGIESIRMGSYDYHSSTDIGNVIPRDSRVTKVHNDMVLSVSNSISPHRNMDSCVSSKLPSNVDINRNILNDQCSKPELHVGLTEPKRYLPKPVQETKNLSRDVKKGSNKRDEHVCSSNEETLSNASQVAANPINSASANDLGFHGSPASLKKKAESQLSHDHVTTTRLQKRSAQNVHTLPKVTDKPVRLPKGTDGHGHTLPKETTKKDTPQRKSSEKTFTRKLGHNFEQKSHQSQRSSVSKFVMDVHPTRLMKSPLVSNKLNIPEHDTSANRVTSDTCVNSDTGVTGGTSDVTKCDVTSAISLASNQLVTSDKARDTDYKKSSSTKWTKVNCRVKNEECDSEVKGDEPEENSVKIENVSHTSRSENEPQQHNGPDSHKDIPDLNTSCDYSNELVTEADNTQCTQPKETQPDSDSVSGHIMDNVAKTKTNLFLKANSSPEFGLNTLLGDATLKEIEQESGNDQDRHKPRENENHQKQEQPKKKKVPTATLR